MLKFKLVLLITASLFATALSKEIGKISLDPPPGLIRADLYFATPVGNPKAVLVLCPGFNENGERLIREPSWRAFAEEHQLGLVGISFSSEPDLVKERDRQGYYYAGNGSGEVLLSGIRRIYGTDSPLLLYGFSGGAHFTSRFVEWKPDRVISWCAYSAGWWDDPQWAKVTPPGIVACGDSDPRYGASMLYFKQGRALGKPWLWIGLRNVGHSRHVQLEHFIRDYFVEILASWHQNPMWVDLDLKRPADGPLVKNHPTLTGWLPNSILLNRWRTIHEP